MKQVIALLTLCLAAGPAFAGDASLKNQDSAAHEIEIRCTSTAKRSIQSGTVISVKDGCRVGVAGGNSVEVQSGQRCEIDRGKISCR